MANETNYLVKAKYGPKIIVADGDDAIRNAFYREYNETATTDVRCFAHVMRNVEKQKIFDNRRYQKDPNGIK